MVFKGLWDTVIQAACTIDSTSGGDLLLISPTWERVLVLPSPKFRPGAHLRYNKAIITEKRNLLLFMHTASAQLEDLGNPHLGLV